MTALVLLIAANIHVPLDQPSIQKAMDVAKPADVIIVSPGLYHERVKLKPKVTLRSTGNDDKGKLGLKRAEATTLEGGVEMAEGATLDGFTVTGVGSYDEERWQHHFDTQGNEQPHEHIGEPGQAGIDAKTNCTVTRNIVHHIGYTGIAITNGSPRIQDNVCFRNMGGGIGSMNGSSAMIERNECFENLYAGIGCDASSPVIHDNFCHDNIRAGIGISDGSSPKVNSNRCFNNRRAGIGIRTGTHTRPVVENNECRDNAMAGIGVEEEARPTLRKNRIINNKLVAIGITGGAQAIIEENELSREGGLPPLLVVLDGCEATVTGNVIRGGGVAGLLVKGIAIVKDNQFIRETSTAKPPSPQAIWAQSGAEITLGQNIFEGWKRELNAAKDAKITLTPKS